MRKNRGLLGPLVAVPVVLAILSAATSAGPPGQTPASTPECHSRKTFDTELRLACSEDGVEFVETPTVLARHAAAPSLVVLPKGPILAVFDCVRSAGDAQKPVLAATRSLDAGRSWSKMRRVELLGGDEHVRAGRGGRLVRMKDGALRLYFTYGPQGENEQRDEKQQSLAVTSAVTRDGIRYRIDSHPPVFLRGRSPSPHPVIQHLGSMVHLFDPVPSPRATDKAHHTPATRAADSRVQHHVSSDGRRFTRVDPMRLSDVCFEGSIVQTPAGLRAYVGSADGIVSLTSLDSRTWRREPGVRVDGGWDPSVVRLESGGYLMVFCAALSDAPSKPAQLVDASGFAIEGEAAARTGKEPAIDDEWGIVIDAAFIDPEVAVASDGSQDTTGDAVASTALAGGEERSPAGTSATTVAGGPESGAPTGTSETFPSSLDGETGGAAGAGDGEGEGEDVQAPVYDPWDWSPEFADDFEGFFAPLPDFIHPFDYLAWFRQEMLQEPEDNAYYAYAEFMPTFADDEKVLPELAGPLNSGYDGPPGPWDPEEHPDWAASNDNIQDLLEQFREATEHEGYASPPDAPFAEEFTIGGKPLLLGMLLPSLSAHRAMAKASMDDAWRLRDGKVSGDRMIEAMRATYRSADHLAGGATLIEQLVAAAERALTQKNARWALEHEVFSADQIETALDVMMEYDRDERDPARWVRGEHATSMDFIQAMFPPPGGDGTPEGREDLVKLAGMLNDWGGTEEQSEAVMNMTVDDARRSAEALDSYYRDLTEMMRTGYPHARVGDLRAKEQEYVNTSPLTKALLPSLSRAYLLGTRVKASDRATKLAYAVELFRQRQGRWPESFDELPARYVDEARIDPFTGQDFGYRLDDDGPVIYSYSENGVDDGAVHSPRWDDKIENDVGSDDFVFYPPQHR